MVYAQTPAQRAEAEALVRELDAARQSPAATFWPAEAYHQDYFANNPRQPYCMGVVAPKVAKFRKSHFDRLKKRTTAG